MTVGQEQKRAMRRNLLRSCGGRCFYCGADLAFECTPKHNGRDWIIIAVASAMEVEHKTPLMRGGRHAVDNVVPSCRRCNSEKRMRTVEEYRFTLSLESGRFPHVFFGESPNIISRDVLVVVSAAAKDALIKHNFPRRTMTVADIRDRRWKNHSARKSPLA